MHMGICIRELKEQASPLYPDRLELVEQTSTLRIKAAETKWELPNDMLLAISLGIVFSLAIVLVLASLRS